MADLNKLAALVGQNDVSGAVQDPEFWNSVRSNVAKMALLPDRTPPGTKGIPTEDQMAQMRWLDLMALRNNPKLSREDQNAIAPYEHRAYAREYSDNPFNALQNAVGSLGYTPFKAVTGGSRSDPSLREVGHGLLGVWEGMTR